MPIHNKDLVKDLRIIAERLNELELHDDAISILKKADDLSEGKTVISSITLQKRVNESFVLSEIYHSLLQHANNDTYNSEKYNLIGDALVEIAIINGGTIGENEAFKILKKKTKFSKETMLIGRNNAWNQHKLTRTARNPFMLSVV
jgi:hypothetical protein